MTGRPPFVAQARAWLAIGTQSVGGGASTLYLMRRLLVRRRGWLTAEEFLEDWTLSRLSPGMHLVALTALVGRRIGGMPGLVLALVAMVGPAAVITAFLAGAFVVVREHPLVSHAVAGMGPVTLGLTLGVTLGITRAAVRAGRRALADLGLLLGAALIGALTTIHVVPVIVAGAILGALFLGRAPARPGDDAADGPVRDDA